MADTAINFSATTIISGALSLIGIYNPNQAIKTLDLNDALRRLNQMISGWGTLPLTFPFVNRQVFPSIANQQTYTIGPGGDFDTIRPTSITASGCLLPAAAVGAAQVEVPVPVITVESFEQIQIKALPQGGSGIWTVLYYQPTYLGGLGSIYIWPLPTTAINEVVIYRGDQIQGFLNATQAYDFPPGYADALEYGLARRLLTTFAVTDPGIRQDVIQGASYYLSMIKATNQKPSDAGIDPAFTQDRRFGYNINTGAP